MSTATRYEIADLSDWALVKLYREYASKRRRALYGAPLYTTRPVGRNDLRRMIDIVSELRRRDPNHPLVDLLAKEDELKTQIKAIQGDARTVPAEMKADLKEVRGKIAELRRRT